MQLIKVVAFAGTGKTTTLVELTKNNPRMKFLLIVFNKAIQLHAQRVFPNNTQCRTAHSLAFTNVGSKYSISPLTVQSIVDSKLLFGQVENRSGNIYRRATMALQTVGAYVVSKDSRLSIDHVPTTNKKDGTALSNIERLVNIF